MGSVASFGQVAFSLATYANNNSITDEIMIRVPVSCTMEGVGMDSHNTDLLNGQYNSAVGETTMHAFCNDNNGFVIYAVGYTDNIVGKNVLANLTLGASHDITTGTAIGPVGNVDRSQWAMKISTGTDQQQAFPVSIQGNFDSFHEVPDKYTAIAKRASNTDVGTSAEGAMLKTTYQAYISKTQPAGTYTGQVKYVLLHPHTTPIPYSTMLDTGSVVSSKMKTIAARATKTYSDNTSDIKAIRIANSIPYGFVATEANTVSAPSSNRPIYIFFDNTNDAGTIYFYAGGYQIIMNQDSSNLFSGNLALTDISGLDTWDSSNVTNMLGMFKDTSITDVDALINWDVEKVTDMSHMFQNTSSLVDVSGITNWDVAGVEATAGASSEDVNNFYEMFGGSAAAPRLFVSRPGIWNSDGTYVPF